mmetsp:Transcript_12129/g.36434  ORF Transcript_12129/g.36434 Transcript_12129/m.36434 type:complete len:202 (-) Transcript_12129:847-1452(-)
MTWLKWRLGLLLLLIGAGLLCLSTVGRRGTLRVTLFQIRSCPVAVVYLLLGIAPGCGVHPPGCRSGELCGSRVSGRMHAHYVQQALKTQPPLLFKWAAQGRHQRLEVLNRRFGAVQAAARQHGTQDALHWLRSFLVHARLPVGAAGRPGTDAVILQRVGDFRYKRTQRRHVCIQVLQRRRRRRQGLRGQGPGSSDDNAELL